MNSASKENLLKTLLNEPSDTPGENKSTFSLKEVSAINVTNPLNEDQLEWQGKTIGLSGDINVNNAGYVYLYDENGNLIMKEKATFKETLCNVVAIDIDENGDMYGLFVYDNKVYLGYFYNPFMANEEGEYHLNIKIAYNLQDDIQEMFNTIGGNGTVYNMDIKKSPIDSRFLITWVFGNNNPSYDLINILYTVNVGQENTFDYRYKKVGSQNYAWIKSVKPIWTNSGISFTMLIMSKNYTFDEVPAEFYKVTGNFNSGSSLSSTLILSEPNYCLTEFSYQAQYTNSKNAVQTDDSIYFISNSINDTVLTTTIYKYDTSLSKVWEKEGLYYPNQYVCGRGNIVKINNQIFAWINIVDDDTLNNLYFMHIVGEEYNEKQVSSGSALNIGIAGIIQNFFNLYVIYLKVSNGAYQEILRYTFKNGYNGEPYYNSNSTNSENMQLLNQENEVVFDRNLYDKNVLGNTVNSITQIPYNYLNNEVIVQEKLKSKNNNVIDENNEEITKNGYEEILITNMDTIKVFDNNNGSAYNQNSSVEIAKNISNGFENNYKITKYRINYENSHTDFPISYERLGNIAIITMYIYNNGVKNIELYDGNFTIPFITIDFSKYEQNKLYKIIQKVKVE